MPPPKICFNETVLDVVQLGGIQIVMAMSIFCRAKENYAFKISPQLLVAIRVECSVGSAASRGFPGVTDGHADQGQVFDGRINVLDAFVRATGEPNEASIVVEGIGQHDEHALDQHQVIHTACESRVKRGSGLRQGSHTVCPETEVSQPIFERFIAS